MDAPRRRHLWQDALTIALLATTLLVTSGCDRPEPTSPEDPAPAATFTRPGAPVVLISIDTLRSDRLPIYGYDKVDTPAIDALRADGVLFERAYSHYPLTLPSHTSLLTGLLPTETGVRDNAGYRLAPDSPTYLPNLLRAAGYATAATVSSYAIRASTGLSQGFDLYDDKIDQEMAGVWGPERPGSQTLAAAIAWLSGRGKLDDRAKVDGQTSEPFFLFFHIYEPHLPHAPPEPFLSRYGATYEGEIAAADATVGGLIQALKDRGLYDDALIILLSDHGEGLDDHLEMGHGIFLYREQLQVPLVLKLPDSHRAGSSVSVPAGLADVMPTVLDLLGVAPPANLTGTSLLGWLDGETGEATIDRTATAREVYAETMYSRIHYGWSELSSLIDGRYHYIEAPQPELYDLGTDPAERDNLLISDSIPDQQRRVYRRMRDRLAQLRVPLEMPAEEDAETRAKLAALGYLTVSDVTATGVDPKVALPRSLALMETAFNLFNAGSLEASIPAFETLLAENPQMTDAWRHLGMALHQVGRLEEAIKALETALRLSRGSQQTAIQIGLVLVALGRQDEARAYMDLAREREPVLAAELGLEIALADGDLKTALELATVTFGPDRVSLASRQRLGLTLSERGRHGEALALLGQLARESENPPTLTALAQAMLNAGRTDEAEPLVERVLREFPKNAAALEFRGLIALSRGQLAGARDALRASLAVNDQRANAWNLLGVSLIQLQDVASALDAWEKSVRLDPEQWDSLYNLGFTAARLGQRDRALRALRQYIDTAPRGRLEREIGEARRLLEQLEG